MKRLIVLFGILGLLFLSCENGGDSEPSLSHDQIFQRALDTRSLAAAQDLPENVSISYTAAGAMVITMTNYDIGDGYFITGTTTTSMSETDAAMTVQIDSQFAISGRESGEFTMNITMTINNVDSTLNSMSGSYTLFGTVYTIS